MIAILFLLPDGLGKRVPVGKGEVCYADGATEDQARKVGEALLKAGFFVESDQQVQLVRRPSGAMAVRFFLNHGGWKDGEIVQEFDSLRRRVLGPALDTSAVEIDLCDPGTTVKRTLR